jgi:23S rRNA pseudouridine2605 synthase
MARAGVASRREAETWIAAGRVVVNGAVITSPAVKIGVRDTVMVDGKPLPRHERTRLFLFHKARGLVTTTADPEGRPTVFDVLPKHLPRLVTIGRLDFSTEGLLLLTNDGGLARVLEHPQTGWLRRYRVRAHGSVTQAQLDALRAGITIEGIHYGPIEATVDRTQGANVWLTFAIREGKNREVRNVLGELGLAVNRLIRISFGPFQLADLAEGAIEEVRTRVLRDQLGKKITALADADFDAPLFTPLEAEAEDQPPTRRAGERPQRSGARPQRGDAPLGGKREGRGARESRAPRGDKERQGRRAPGGDDSRKGAPRPGETAGKKPRPWHGRGRDLPIREPAAESGSPRKTKSGLLTDRKGRRVLVQRVQTEPAAPEPAPRRGRPGSKPARDRRRGPRPSRPFPSGGGKR